MPLSEVELRVVERLLQVVRWCQDQWLPRERLGGKPRKHVLTPVLQIRPASSREQQHLGWRAWIVYSSQFDLLLRLKLPPRGSSLNDLTVQLERCCALGTPTALTLAARSRSLALLALPSDVDKLVKRTSP